MLVTAQPDWLDELTSNARTSLSRNNDRLAKGSDQILISPSFEDTSDDEIETRLEEILSKAGMTEELRKIEDSNLAKFGPRSIAQSWEARKEALYAYFKHEGVEPILTAKPGRLRPVDFQRAAKQLVSTSNSGLPFMVRKGDLKTKSPEEVMDVGYFPCVLFTRTQEQGKTRDIWGYPVRDTIRELQFYIPWLEVEKRLMWRTALLGPDHVDTAISRLLLNKSADLRVVCVDFSRFDATISPRNAMQAFEYIASHFQDPAAVNPILEAFMTIGIWTPDGEISGPHGVPSGSTFTNAVDSVVQFQLAGVGEARCQIQGDDGVYLVTQSEHDSLIERFRYGGLSFNEDKSNVFETQEAVYLQRYYHPDYRRHDGELGGVYSAYRAFMRLKYLERWTDLGAAGIAGRDYFSIRAVMILENCKYHPAFRDLVHLAREIDRDGLMFDRNALKPFSKTVEARVRATSPALDITGGIESFETMKLLAE